jgi:hypothetical protein
LVGTLKDLPGGKCSLRVVWKFDLIESAWSGKLENDSFGWKLVPEKVV